MGLLWSIASRQARLLGMLDRKRLFGSLSPRGAHFLLAVGLLANSGGDTSANVLQATLDNGLRVVIVRDPLAPVSTLEENYLVEGQETAATFPGMAHAREHMAFQGCAGVSADQIATIYAQVGGSSNADTQQNTNQYFVTVPAQDLEMALHVDSASMQDVEHSFIIRLTTLAESSEETAARGQVARAFLDLPLYEPARAAQRYYALAADDIKNSFGKWIRTNASVQVVRRPAPR